MNSTLTYALGTSLLVVSLANPPVRAADKVDLVRDIKPLFEVHCLSCHTAKKPKGDLSMETRADNIKGGEKGTSLVPGEPDKSTIYTTTILPAGHDDIMPPKGDPLSKAQTDVIKQWIQEGAEWPETVKLKPSKKASFADDIKPIFEVHCLSCHKEGNAKGKLNMETLAGVLKGGDDGPGLVPGLPGKSPIYTSMILPADHDDLMPPSNKGGPLPAEVADLVANWIVRGAEWPEGEKLTQKKKEEATTAGEDKAAKERAVVQDIHKKVMANHKVAGESDMKPYTNHITGTAVTYAMVPIPGGEFTIGSPESEPGHKPDEAPQVKVKISPFWKGQSER